MLIISSLLSSDPIKRYVSKPFISSFTFLGDEQEIDTPEGQNVGNQKNNNSNSENSNYDQMIQSRNNEFNLPQRR